MKERGQDPRGSDRLRLQDTGIQADTEPCAGQSEEIRFSLCGHGLCQRKEEIRTAGCAKVGRVPLILV